MEICKWRDTVVCLTKMEVLSVVSVGCDRRKRGVPSNHYLHLLVVFCFVLLLSGPSAFCVKRGNSCSSQEEGSELCQGEGGGEPRVVLPPPTASAFSLSPPSQRWCCSPTVVAGESKCGSVTADKDEVRESSSADGATRTDKHGDVAVPAANKMELFFFFSNTSPLLSSAAPSCPCNKAPHFAPPGFFHPSGPPVFGFPGQEGLHGGWSFPPSSSSSSGWPPPPPPPPPVVPPRPSEQQQQQSVIAAAAMDYCMARGETAVNCEANTVDAATASVSHYPFGNGSLTTTATITLVGRRAPFIDAEVVSPSGAFDSMKLSDYYGRKYVLLLFYPADFTYVCPSELLAFNEARNQFEQRDVQLLGVSVDSKFSHAAWRQLPVKQGGIGEIGFPLVSDITKNISRRYGVLTADGSVSLRGLFLIDKQGLVQHQLVNNLPIGRHVQEALRVVDALQHTEKVGEVCPANWTKGKPGMTPSQEGVQDYMSQHLSSRDTANRSSVDKKL